MAQYTFLGFLKRKKEETKPEPVAQRVAVKPVIIEKEREKPFLLYEREKETSIVYKNKIILSHSEEKTFLTLYLAESAYKETTTVQKKGLFKKESKTTAKYETNIKKTIPLSSMFVVKCDDAVQAVFHNKGYRIKLEMFIQNGRLVYSIDNPYPESFIEVNVPRETNNEISIWGDKKSVSAPAKYDCNRGWKEENPENPGESPWTFKTILPLFFDGEKDLCELKCDSRWSLNVEKNVLRVRSVGHKTQILFIFGEDKEQLKKIFNMGAERARFPSYKRGGIYTDASESDYRQKILSAEAGGKKLDGVFLGIDYFSIEAVKDAVNFCKSHNVSAYIKMTPYIPVKIAEKAKVSLVKNSAGKNLAVKMYGKECFAADLLNRDVCRWLQNIARTVLDLGAGGIVAECGQLDLDQISLFGGLMPFAVRWSGLWQGLFVLPIKEYPNSVLFVRHNTLSSREAGIPVSD